MKELKAFIKPNRVQKTIEALSDAGFKSMTLSQGEGTGALRQKGPPRPSIFTLQIVRWSNWNWCAKTKKRKVPLILLLKMEKHRPPVMESSTFPM